MGIHSKHMCSLRFRIFTIVKHNESEFRRKSSCLSWIFVLERSISFFLPRPVELLWTFHDGRTLLFHTRVWRWFLRKAMFSCRRERSFYRAPPRSVKNRRVFSSYFARDVYSIEFAKAWILTTACSDCQKDTCFCNSNFLYKRFIENTFVFTQIW